MKTIQKSLRIEQSIFEQIENMEDTFAASIEYIIETFALQRKTALRRMKKKFTREELITICDIYNGVMFERYWMSDVESMVAEIEDSETFDSISTRHGIIIEDTIRKIRSLSELEIFYLHYEIYRFWHVSKAYGSPSPDLEKFISFLS